MSVPFPKFDKTWQSVGLENITDKAVYSVAFKRFKAPPSQENPNGGTTSDARIDLVQYPTNSSYVVKGTMYVVISEDRKEYCLVEAQLGMHDKHGKNSSARKALQDAFPAWPDESPDSEPLAKAVGAAQLTWFKGTAGVYESPKDGSIYTSIKYINAWPKDAPAWGGRKSSSKQNDSAGDDLPPIGDDSAFE